LYSSGISNSSRSKVSRVLDILHEKFCGSINKH
jgi:hypothetical protein